MIRKLRTHIGFALGVAPDFTSASLTRRENQTLLLSIVYCRDILDLDLALPAEKVHEIADVAVAHTNAVIGELRRLFLVEDLVDSLKFGVLLWCLTYVGSWFNGMTLIIIGKCVFRVSFFFLFFLFSFRFK